MTKRVRLLSLTGGISTGGILALGLTKPRAERKPDFAAVRWWHCMRRKAPGFSIGQPGGGLAEKKYPCQGIEGVLERYFGEARLKDALADVLVTNCETERRFPFFFKSRNAREKKNYDSR